MNINNIFNEEEDFLVVRMMNLNLTKKTMKKKKKK
jgi:hypothetical protein